MINIKLKVSKIRISRRRRGSYLPVILMASVLFLAFATAIITLSMSNVKIANLHNKKITSMSIAEAGINYYLWHLSHDNEDYCDGQTCGGTIPYGPYQHNYTDEAGNILGTYELFITPPTPGQSFVTVKSVGKVNGKSPTRTIITTIGMPSFTKYTLLVNGEQLWVGPNEKITGTVHVNGSGMYNEGEITGDASSTESTYQSWNWGTQPGVAGSGIFGGSKLYPVTPVDFNQVDVDIKTIRDDTKTNDPSNYYDNAPSGSNGYHVVLKTDSYDLYKVTKYSNTGLNIINETLLGNHNYPQAGIIFLEDNVWINGTINGQKITVIAADPEKSGNQRKRIIVPDLIKYTNYDGSDKIGLITQTDILLTRNAPSIMEIDAAMIAKDGEIKINSYCNPSQTCSSDQKTKIKVYGSMAHNTGLIWTYDYGGGKWSGYNQTETVIDQHNVLNPPPKFPLTGTYVILSWREE
ncbi:MAG: hypothetical protein M1324_00220 [Patescibacteria group bacterium]|nr:hypothetical protein [Patescibacteria group bacterium]